MITDADGTPATGVVAATAGHLIEYRRDGAAVVTDATAADDLASLTTAHTDWEFLHIFDGYYTVAVPDAAFASGVGNVLVNMRATGISGVAESVEIDQFIKYQGKPSSVTATTTTFPSGTTPKQGDEIYVINGTGERQTRLVTSATGEVATHLAWDDNISATTSVVVLLPGDETIADGGILVDTAVSTRSDLNTTNVNTACSAALVTYDGPTRAEATSDKDEVLAVLPSAAGPTRAEATADKDAVLAKLPAALTVGGRIRSAVEVVNSRVVTGTGQEGDEWGDGGAET